MVLLGVSPTEYPALGPAEPVVCSYLAGWSVSLHVYKMCKCGEAVREGESSMRVRMCMFIFSSHWTDKFAEVALMLVV